MADEITDDAIHITAPWDVRWSLCGQSNRLNLAKLEDDRPDGWAGCWTCLAAARWLDVHLVKKSTASDLELIDY